MAQIRMVAPRAGAWIETRHKSGRYGVDYVAPRAGAWIETQEPRTEFVGFASHPVRVRGLKRYCLRCLKSDLLVAPRAGAWIETNSD